MAPPLRAPLPQPPTTPRRTATATETGHQAPPLSAPPAKPAARPSGKATTIATALAGRQAKASEIAQPFWKDGEHPWWPAEAVHFSKWLSFVLRHDPDFPVRPDGYATIADVLSHPLCPSGSLDFCLQVIVSSGKRFGVFLDGNDKPKWVRANDGHSLCKGISPSRLMEHVKGEGLSFVFSTCPAPKGP